MGYLLLHSNQPSAKRLLQRVEECTGVDSPIRASRDDVVIRWGNVDGDDSQAAWTLNPRQAILNTRNRSRMLRVLKQNGVYSPSVSSADEWRSDLARDVQLDSQKRVRIARHYRVPIFDMQPLSLFKAEEPDIWLDQGNGTRKKFAEVEFDEDVYATRAVRLALRAIHALGLDFGLVSVGITARDRTIVLDVTPQPRLRGRMLELFEEAVDSFVIRDREEERMFREEGRNSVPFQMGTDLEFMLRSPRGKLVLASRYLPRKGRVGCDDRSINLDQKRFPLAELRPYPATTPEGLLHNIKDALVEADTLIKSQKVQWLAGSMPFSPYSIGGHLHFSDLGFSSRLVKAFDNYLGFPLMMIEDSHTATKRRPKYGFLGDVRFKTHGGFEYRTPASFLVSPEVTEAVLALAYVIAIHHRQLTADLFTHPRTQRYFYKSDKAALREDFELVWAQLERTSTYRRYQDSLKIIPQMVRKGVSWNEAVDIRREWESVLEQVHHSLTKPTAVQDRNDRKRNGRSNHWAR
ncbi:MAG TPA: hypothetical protein VFV52_16305 [Bacilli bacterium]|nr:hypothetical protein [Bacilli bacterium]